MASFSNFLNQGSNFLTGAVGSVANRLSQAGLPIGGIFNTNRQSSLQSNVGAPSATGDWAVKVTVSDSVFADLMSGSPVFPASFKKNKGIRFPVTPFINMSHSAAYDARSVVHNNYPYYAYQNSQVDQMTIAGSFPVANEKDGQNWLASLHFLRTVTKMYYGGGDANQGNPPPVCRLNGYGDLIYKDVPIIITNFTVELREQVDYIGVGASTGSTLNDLAGSTQNNVPRQNRFADVRNVGPQNGNFADDFLASDPIQAVESSGGINYVPTDSLISITVVPVYSRNKISNNFNLKDFASGKLTRGQGFI